MLACPRCAEAVFMDELSCRSCGVAVGYHPPSRTMLDLTEPSVEIEGRTWYPCSRRGWKCNWVAPDGAEAGRCFSCGLIRARPASDDTIALERLAETMLGERRLLIQLDQLGLPVDPWHEADGGLGFDLLSSYSRNERVSIGHANGIVTIDLAESLDAHRERLRVALGEPYRTMLGHFRHEVGHYYEWILVERPESSAWIDECREIFGDQRTSYADAIDRHYRYGAPEGWQESFISEYATMHPWEDFAESFAHYLHITDTLETSWSAGLELRPGREAHPQAVWNLQVRRQYGADDFPAMLEDWRALSLFFNRVNRSMGKDDLYPFTIGETVARKLDFVHRLIVGLPELPVAPDGFRRLRAIRTTSSRNVHG
ncbi:hypothetical protein FLP23_06865 [Protaetiibacter larvae]|uniref:Zinc-ribbon domain-containing protein n=2 Tax=Protaetiibacter larvae TaxID=2592654 RepID=A0A5C1YD50_9MICO|nr:hypothetical protein FLP23_06865 [Protaetiibacter larvae]